MLRRRAALLALLAASAACGGLKDALTSHVDVAAKAGSQELTSAALADMMQSASMPPRPDLAAAVANLWVNYQLLVEAAVRGDTLGEAELADEAMWAQVAQRRLQKFQAEVQKGFAIADNGSFEKAYADGELLVARHILISADRNTLPKAEIDAARRKADNIRRQVTPANFASMAQRHSTDPGSKDRGGEYVFGAGEMVPEFEMGTRSLKPGEISDPIQTAYGFHIILRETYPEARSRFDSAYVDIARQKAESTWLVGLEVANDVKVKDGAATLVRSIAEDVDKYRTNRTVVATSRAVDLRASRVASWIAAFPPQLRIRQQIQQAPDSMLPMFVRNLIRNELLLRAADSARVELDSAEVDQVRSAFRVSVQNSMGGLGILPSQLADSAGVDRAGVARARVNAYFDRLLKNQAQFIDVSEPVSAALRRRYDGRVNTSGVDRAVALATEAQARADSAANATMPPTEVPMPGAPGSGGAAGGTTPPPTGAKTP